MTLNRSRLRRGNSPRSARKSPSKRLNNTSLRKKALIKQLSSDVQFGGSSKANVKVVVRVRPENKRELECNAQSVLKVADEHLLVFDPKEEEDDFFFQGVRQSGRDFNKKVHKEQKFMFEHVFNVDSTNEQIFDNTTRDLIDTVLNGYNCSVFAYGATGAGKTFTMLGKPECPGITFLTVMALFERIEELIEEKTIEIGVSYLEVYNETVRDLLKPGGKPLNVQENGIKVLVPGLSLHKPSNAEELMKMLSFGNTNRTQHPTDANADSSRSHAVFQVFVKQQDRTANVKSSVSLAKLSMIDLAGSERGSATGCKGARFREGANINKSLLALGNCINALADGLRHIPYRDSKLTRLLKDSLGGNCRSVMIAAVTRARTSYEDTFNTLRYAERAKTIKTKLEKNIQNVDHHVTEYVKIVESLREEIISLKEKIEILESAEDLDVKEMEDCADGTFVAAAPAPTDSGAAQKEQMEYQSRIAQLEQQLGKAKKNSSNTELVCEEEAECQRLFQDQISERKALRRELLQLESQERELQIKVHTTKVHLARMKIVSFAAMRLDKSISKSERSIKNLTIMLEQTIKRKKMVEAKVEKSVKNIRDLQLKLNQFGEEQVQPSKASYTLIEKNNNELALRDSYHMTEYLKGLVKKGIYEQAASDKLVDTLLNATMKFYVLLKGTGQCSQDVEETLESVVEQLDESKVAWADQQLPSIEESKPEGVPDMPQLDISHLVSLTINKDVYISPFVKDSSRVLKRSIMKSSKSTPSLPRLLSPGIPGASVIIPGKPCTPSASRTITLNTTTTLEPSNFPSTPSHRPSSAMDETPRTPILVSKFADESIASITPKCPGKQDSLNPKTLKQCTTSEESIHVKREEKDTVPIPVESIGYDTKVDINTKQVFEAPLQMIRSDNNFSVNDSSNPAHKQNINSYITPSKPNLNLYITPSKENQNSYITPAKAFIPVITTDLPPSCTKVLNRSPENISSGLGFLSMCPGSRAPIVLPKESSENFLCDNSILSNKSADFSASLRSTVPVITSNSNTSSHWLTKDSVEILEDISMPDISFNSTISVTPAKPIIQKTIIEENRSFKTLERIDEVEPLSNISLNTTIDLPSETKFDKDEILESLDSIKCLNTTIDFPSSTKPFNLNTTVDLSEPSSYQVTKEIVPSSVGVLNVTVDLGKPDTASVRVDATTNITKPSIVSGKDQRRSYTIVRTSAEDACNQTFTMDDEDKVPQLSVAPVLDSTFSLDFKSDKANLEDLGIAPLSPGVIPGRPLSMNNPSHIPSGIKGPSIITPKVEGSLMPPPSKTPINQSKKGCLPKSPPFGHGRGNLTPRGSKSHSGLRRSVSTPTLVPPKVSSSLPSTQPSPNMERKFTGLGGAIRRTNSFLNRKSNMNGNEENVPPMSRLARPHQPLAQRHMSASSLPQPGGNNVLYRQ